MGRGVWCFPVVLSVLPSSPLCTQNEDELTYLFAPTNAGRKREEEYEEWIQTVEWDPLTVSAWKVIMMMVMLS